MKKKRKIYIIIFSLLLLFIIRESGIIDIYWCQNTIQSFCSTELHTVGNEKVNLKNIHISIWPSPLDYIPLYKKRHFKGIVIKGNDKECLKSYFKLSYDIHVTTFGFCSGSRFRQLARQEIIKKIQK